MIVVFDARCLLCSTPSTVLFVRDGRAWRESAAVPRILPPPGAALRFLE
ncbi:hypothetical protein [Ralstonia chuxiongensis]|uniref:Uncharacterized protein n=1 Tax=Ralstonia chuxiongensis TaxID=2957504 RepID=A0AA42BHK6_9RALS|nr:hypothetical protein [Ralstonia chuxiongensis]MCP1172979.1 hypothetical protein [Ralstonia chuxiongensis]